MSRSKEKEHKSILDLLARFTSYILRLIFVPRCIICGEILEKDGELCPECLALWDSARREKCPVCKKTARACTCRPHSMFGTDRLGDYELIALTFYTPHNSDDIKLRDIAASKIVWSVKTSPYREAVRLVSRELAGAILRSLAAAGESPSNWYLTYPPRTSKRRHQYGFDQGRDIVRAVSKFTGIPVDDCIVNVGSSAQKKLNTVERKTNAAHSYRLSPKASPVGKKYIIADDVITTGATVSACAELLKQSGAEAVFPVCIARTKKKKRNVRRPAERPWFKFNTKA